MPVLSVDDRAIDALREYGRVRDGYLDLDLGDAGKGDARERLFDASRAVCGELRRCLVEAGVRV